MRVIPQNANQISELNRWNIQPNSLKNCRIFIPANASPIIGDETIFRIRPRDVTQQDWCLLLGQPIYGPQGHILGETLRNLANTDFSIQNMIDFITDTTNFTTLPDASRNAIAYRLIEYGRSGLFNRDGLDVADLLKPNTCNVFMLRELRNEDKSLITALIARRLFTIMGEFHSRKRVSEFFERSYDGHVLPNKVWLLIDEGHVIAPAAIESPAREALVEYVKRGRDAGLSLVLATQQPSAIHDGILSQVNLSFNHRLTFQNDINAAINRIPTKTLSSLKLSGTNISDFGDMLRLLEAGQCFLGDHSTSRTVMVQVRPRVTSHGGYSPK